MNTNYKRMSKCLCCDESLKKDSVLLDLGKQPLANNFHAPNKKIEDYPLAVKKCNKCFHVQLSVAVKPSLLYENYSYVSGTTKTLKDYFINFADKIEKKFKGKKLSILEIACNDGTLLEIFQKRGHQVLGVDPAKNLRKFSKSKGLNIIVDYWDKKISKKINKKFDLIIAQNVLAHVSSPKEFLDSVGECLKEDGIAAIQTSQYYMFKNFEFDTIYHEHHSFFSIKSLDSLLRGTNLFMHDAEIVKIHGGSLLSYLKIKSKKNIVKKRKINLLQNERKFLNNINFKKFSKFASKFNSKLNKVIKDYKDLNYKIVGYGAAAKTNTVLNFCKINLDFIIDDNSIKVNKLTPGMNIVVKDRNSLKSLSKDNVLFFIGAWNFYEEITGKIKKLRKNKNDKFLTFFPKFKLK